jgi:serine/threonine-protein kinase RsbW
MCDHAALPAPLLRPGSARPSLAPASAPHAAEPAASVRKHCQVFPAAPSQVRQARNFLAAALGACPVADDAILCLSELASNAVLHSDSRKPGGTFTVRAEVHDGDYVWIEVEDNGGLWEERDHCDQRPHGLDIVRKLTTDNGRDGDAVTGWGTWAQLDWPAPASRQSRPRRRGYVPPGRLG